MEVNNIAIKLQQINFDKDTKEELNKFAKTYRMEVKVLLWLYFKI